jgi:SAM-dependent methyltransferase/alkylated DNA repair dioxygenase AlkB
MDSDVLPFRRRRRGPNGPSSAAAAVDVCSASAAKTLEKGRADLRIRKALSDGIGLPSVCTLLGPPAASDLLFLHWDAARLTAYAAYASASAAAAVTHRLRSILFPLCVPAPGAASLDAWLGACTDASAAPDTTTLLPPLLSGLLADLQAAYACASGGPPSASRSAPASSSGWHVSASAQPWVAYSVPAGARLPSCFGGSNSLVLEPPPGRGFVGGGDYSRAHVLRQAGPLAPNVASGTVFPPSYSYGRGGAAEEDRRPVRPVPGFVLVRDFVSATEERRLVRALAGETPGEGPSEAVAEVGTEDTAWVPILSRRVKHFGFGFDYVARRAVPPGEGGTATGTIVHPLPPPVAAPSEGTQSGANRCPARMPADWHPLRWLADRVSECGFVGGDDFAGPDAVPWNTLAMDGAPFAGPDAVEAVLQQWRADRVSSGVPDCAPFPIVDQVTVNEYPRGKGIAPHIDVHDTFQDGIASLSLCDDSVLELTLPDNERTGGGKEGSDVIGVFLPQRSLFVLRGEARHRWQHSIPPRRTDTVDGRLRDRGVRLSVTMRRVRDPVAHPCACRWPRNCVSQNGGSSEPTVLNSPALQRLKQLALLEQGNHVKEIQPGLGDSINSNGYSNRNRNSDNSRSDSNNNNSSNNNSKKSKTSGDVGKPSGGSSKTKVAEAVPPTALQPHRGPSYSEAGGVGNNHPSNTAAGAPSSLCATDVESLHVHRLYDAIAPHFSSTRHSPWPRVEAYLRRLDPGCVLLDVGCGNGKYLALCSGKAGNMWGDEEMPRLAAVGCDRSEGLMSICVGDRGLEGCVADAVSLPFRSSCADVTLSVAVLHHISTLGRRVALVRELLRVTRPGGQVFVQAWALEQGAASRRAFPTQDVFVPWHLQRRFLPELSGAEVEAAGGTLEGKNAIVFQRYCHVYRQGELEELVCLALAPEDQWARYQAMAPAAAAAELGVALVPIDDGDLKKSWAGEVQAADDATAATKTDVPPPEVLESAVPARVSVLESWWDCDNWCIVLRKNA